MRPSHLKAQVRCCCEYVLADDERKGSSGKVQNLSSKIAN